MSYNGSGTFVINTAGQPVVSGTVISSTAFNALTADLATGLSTAITKDGQTTPTANIPMGNNKITGLAVGTAATDAANLSQVQSTTAKLINSVSGADTVTGTMSPTLTAYAAGQMFYWIAAGANTGAVTLNIDSLGAKAVTRDGSTALAAGDIRSGEVVVVVYDGTRFQVVSQINSAGDATFANVSITSALNVGGVATFTGNPVFSGGTANGVLYLNGSKVATSGSTLTFDGTNLGVNSSSTIDGGRFNVAFAGNTQNGIGLKDTVDASGASFWGAYNSTGGFIGSLRRSGTDNALAINGNSYLAFQQNSSEQMRLTSTGLGIGTSSPNSLLDVYKDSGTAYSSANILSMGQWARISNPNTTSGTGASLLFRANASSLAAVSCVSTAASNSAAMTFAARQSDGTLAEQMRLDSSGNLGIGTSSPNTRLDVSQANAKSATGIWQIQSFDSTSQTTGVGGGISFGGYKTAQSAAEVFAGIDGYKENSTAGNAAGALRFHTQVSLGSGLVERMRLDSSGNLGIGTSSPSNRLDVQATTAKVSVTSTTGTNTTFYSANNTGGAFYFGLDNSAGTEFGTAYAGAIYRSGAYPITFYTNATERARITSGGYFKASDNGTYAGSTSAYHEFYQSTDNWGLLVSSVNASQTATSLEVRASRDTTNGSFNAIRYFNVGAGAAKFIVADSGNVTNTNGSYGTISDAKMKTDIVDAGSQWDDIKAVRFRKFKMKDDPAGLVQLGVVAQELEQTSPGLVDEHTDRDAEGNDLGTTTKSVKTSVLLMKAAVALQEAMARIEQLEAKVAALETK